MTREEVIIDIGDNMKPIVVDCISRQAVLDLINADWKYEGLEIEINNLPSVTPQPCEDAVSRQALLNATVNKNSVWNKITDSKGENLEAIISKLPSVTPQEPRKGHWIDTKEISTNRRGQIVHEVICSECSGIAYFRSMGNKYIGANLCPNCGCRMGE